MSHNVKIKAENLMLRECMDGFEFEACLREHLSVCVWGTRHANRCIMRMGPQNHMGSRVVIAIGQLCHKI